MTPHRPTTLTDSLESLFSSLPDSVRVLSRDGEVLFKNEASLLVCHREIEEQSAGDRSAGSAAMREEVFTKGVFQRRHLVYRAPGAKKEVSDYYEATMSPLRDGSGEIWGVLEILRDETMNFGLQHYLIGRSEKQETEISRQSVETVRLQEREEQLSTALVDFEARETEFLYRDRVSSIGQMAGGLAHEIRTPLGAILSSSDLARRSLTRLAQETDPDAREKRIARLQKQLELVSEGSRRIHSVLKALQSFSRLDESDTKEIPVSEGLESTVQLIQYRMGDRIRLTREYHQDPIILCRPDALNQVFMNLLMNAVQAIPERGSIEIVTEWEAPDAVIQIRDSGSGIPAEALDKIFELGFTTKGAAGGTGLGLAVCRKIIEEHQGTLSILKSDASGTTFEVRLPGRPA